MRASFPEENPDVIRRALLLACERIADGPQLYHEANDSLGWAEVYMEQAADEMRCERCGGTGTAHEDKCDDCGGMGYVFVSEACVGCGITFPVCEIHLDADKRCVKCRLAPAP